MNKKQHYFLAIIITIVLSLIDPVIFAVEKNEHKQNNSQTTMVFFYANGCPHCDKVEAFMQKKRIANYFTIDQREVNTANNNALLADTLAKCQITVKTVELPILWTGTTCMFGDENIISFFEKELQ